jgi:hypothetical protein
VQPTNGKSFVVKELKTAVEDVPKVAYPVVDKAKLRATIDQYLCEIGVQVKSTHADPLTTSDMLAAIRVAAPSAAAALENILPAPAAVAKKKKGNNIPAARQS